MSNETNNEEKSFVLVEFADIGSAEISYSDFNNVTAFQMLALAHLMEFEGKTALANLRAAQIQAQMQQGQRDKILVPKPDIGIGK
jgi:hypothetical protein